MSDVAGWISAIAESITAAGVVLAFLQLRDAKAFNRDNHERARREGAVQYGLVWTTNMTQYSSNASKLVDVLDPHQCTAIAQRRELNIALHHLELLSSSFQTDVTFKQENGAIFISARQAAELRWTVLRYLNLLETICAAWRAATVDRKIIEDEFCFLLQPRDGRRLMRNFREAIGNDFFPAIGAFEYALEVAAESPASPNCLDG